MTRFEAAESVERRKLFADAIVAHRERASGFCTAELDPSAVADEGESDDAEEADATDAADEGLDGLEGAGGDEDAGGDGEEGTPPVPWIQFADRTFNLDCTDDELERLKDLLDEFPEFRIDAMESPEEAEGTNVRISARSDANRLAAFIDRAFEEVYGAPEAYRAWVVAV